MSSTKLIAFYLPQFHETEENNQWWGKGFTEWTNVKNAKALYPEHYQPKVPLDDNYYCLLDESVQLWQAKLAQKYGIYGFCYYHYWFNGKLLLQKPMENMLKNPSINIPFCISWANEPWTRTWTGKDKEILMPQCYGTETEWEQHLDYLLPFFKDKRYILVDNKPLLLIYRSSNIDKCESMVNYWDSRLKNEGFAGIYLVETLTGWQTKRVLPNSSATVDMEPMYTIATKLPYLKKATRFLSRKFHLSQFGILDLLDYDYIWKKVLYGKAQISSTAYKGAFVSWDNTARRGIKGWGLKGFSPQKFLQYFKIQYERCVNNEIEFLFINAWNEWSEGTYLEPDKKYNHEILEAIKNVVQEYDFK